MPIFVSADHIAAQNGAFEPQRKNNFTLILEMGGDTELIQRALDEFPIPKEGNAPIDVNFGNEVRKVAGRATFDDLSLVLKDFVDQRVVEQMIQWRRQVYNPSTGAIGLARDYKKQGEVIMFGPDGERQRTWKLFGVWPSKLDPGGGNMNANENNKIQVTITIDKAIEQ